MVRCGRSRFRRAASEAPSTRCCTRPRSSKSIASRISLFSPWTSPSVSRLRPSCSERWLERRSWANCGANLCRWYRTSSAPLGIIQSSAEILEDYLDQLEPAEREDHLRSIRSNTRRMAGIMEEVLLIGSFDAGKMEFKPAALELRSFLERLVDEVLAATGRRCPIELSISEKPAEIHGDERLLRHIFTNLLTNAIKYSDAGRTVRLEIARLAGEIVCAVCDRGIGIPEADREWLFNAFHRGHNVDDRPGTGLGLVIVKRCVDLHGGKINVESKLGEGTVVTVGLPIFFAESPPARR